MDLERPLLIPGVLTAGDKIVVVAAPKVGKSLLAQQLAQCLVGGHSFLGFKPVNGEHRVLYVAAEGDVDELQARTRAMASVLPVPPDRLWYWPVPSQPLNTQSGFEKLMEFGGYVEPALTVLDPMYALMRGSMKEDAEVSALMRGVNRYQYETGSAVVLIHHTHRPVKAEGGGYIDEGDESYFGSFVVKAWPRALWVMTEDGKNTRHVKLACRVQRSRASQIGTRSLTLAEPDPLVFVDRVDNLNASQIAVLAALSVAPHTQAALAERLERSLAVISECLSALRNQGRIVEDGAWPARYTIRG